MGKFVSEDMKKIEKLIQINSKENFFIFFLAEKVDESWAASEMIYFFE